MNLGLQPAWSHGGYRGPLLDPTAVLQLSLGGGLGSIRGGSRVDLDLDPPPPTRIFSNIMGFEFGFFFYSFFLKVFFLFFMSFFFKGRYI